MGFLSAACNSIASTFQPTNESDLAYGPSLESELRNSTSGSRATLLFTSYATSKYSGGDTLPGHTAWSIIPSSANSEEGQSHDISQIQQQSWNDVRKFHTIASGVVERQIQPAIELPDSKSIDPSHFLDITNKSETDYEKRVKDEVEQEYSDFYLPDESRNFDIKHTDWAGFSKVVPEADLAKLPFLPHNYEDPKTGSKSKQG